MADGQKLAGSAQRRTNASLIQHGSVVLRRTHPVQPSAAISELVGQDVSFEQFAEALVAAIERAGIRLGSPEPAKVDGDQFAAQYSRHSSEQWIQRR
ncbi:MAG: hypothetical protein HQ546_07955 [Planctomycetes bacterium]|nr:hypothetical protein [Planctomycetota bacterium]